MLATIIILALFGTVMLCLEVVLPGAIIGILGGGLVIASIVLTFVSSEMQGYGIAVQGSLTFGIIAISATTLVLWMRYFHKTFLGRRLILQDTVGGPNVAPDDTPSLAGQEGVAKTDLRPGGIVIIDGKRYEAHSVAGYVERGTTVRVQKIADTILNVIAIHADSTSKATDTIEC